MKTDADRRREIRTLWLARPEDKRGGNDVLVFHGWLEQQCPDLLQRTGGGDSFQQLRSDLHGLWNDE